MKFLATPLEAIGVGEKDLFVFKSASPNLPLWPSVGSAQNRGNIFRYRSNIHSVKN